MNKIDYILKNYELIIDYLYKNSSLNNFINISKIKDRNICINNEILTLENFKIYANIPSLGYYGDFDLKKECINALIKEGQKSLDHCFLNFIENNLISSDFYPLFPKKPFSRIIKFFTDNFRFNIKTKDKNNIEFGKYFCEIIKDFYLNSFNYSDNDEQIFIIVSPEIADFIIKYINDFKLDTINSTNISSEYSSESFGKIILKNFNCLVYKNYSLNNSMYIGTIKNMAIGSTLFYHIPENALNIFSETQEEKMNLNLFYKFFIIENAKYKKIIFE